MQKEKHNPSGTQAVSYIVKLNTYLNLRFPVHISFPKGNRGERRTCLMEASKILVISPRGASVKFLPYSSVDTLKTVFSPISPSPHLNLPASSTSWVVCSTCSAGWVGSYVRWFSSQCLYLPSLKYRDLNLHHNLSNILKFSQLYNDCWKSTLQIQNARKVIHLIFLDSSCSLYPNISCQQLLFNALPCYQLSRLYFTTIMDHTISFRTVLC